MNPEKSKKKSKQKKKLKYMYYIHTIQTTQKVRRMKKKLTLASMYLIISTSSIGFLTGLILSWTPPNKLILIAMLTAYVVSLLIIYLSVKNLKEVFQYLIDKGSIEGKEKEEKR